jgi:ACT domain-containing protein
MKKLITERELETVGQGGQFTVETHMILTPSAHDYSSLHGIRLVYPEPEESSESVEESAMDRAIREAVIAEFGRTDHKVMKAVRDGLAASDAKVEAPVDVSGVISELRADDAKNRVVVAAVGANRTGILSRLTDTIARFGCDVKNVSQTLVGGYFSMILIVEIDSLEAQNVTFEQFRNELAKETSALGLEAMIVHEDVLKAMHRI